MMAYCRHCGAQIDDYAVTCPECGAPQNGGRNDAPKVTDNGGFLWGLLGCCVPLAGLILFLVWKDTKPRTAKAAGIGRPGVRDRLCAAVRDRGGGGHRLSPVVCLLSCGAGSGGGCPSSSAATAGQTAPFAFAMGPLFPSVPVVPGSWRGSWRLWLPAGRPIPPAAVAAVLLLPLVADGFLQLCTSYESGNLRRLITGILFGYGLTVLLAASLGWAYRWGFHFGLTLLEP